MKKDEFIFLIGDDNGNLRRLHAVNEFTLIRRENEADTLSVSVRNSYDLPLMRNVPEKEKVIAEYDGEVIFTGDIIGYERKTGRTLRLRLIRLRVCLTDYSWMKQSRELLKILPQGELKEDI